MKPRQQRRKVVIRAQMRSGSRWADICILNISERGLGMQCAVPPARGTYAEVRRGSHVIIGRVTWSKGHRFGISTQDALAVEAIVREPDNSNAAPAKPAPGRPADRWAAPRTRLDRHERSRNASRVMEFGFVIALGVSAAAVAFQSVELAFAEPLGRVTGSIGGK